MKFKKNIRYNNFIIKYKCDFYLFVFSFWYATEIIFSTNVKRIFGFEMSELNTWTGYMVLLMLVFYIVVYQKYSVTEFRKVFFISIPFIISALLSSRFNFLSAWLFIVAAKKKDFDDIIKAAYKISGVLIPTIILLCILGYIENYWFWFRDIRRYSMGFAHPNHLGMRVFQFLACHFYIRRKTIKLKDIILAICLILFVYYVPNSQTSCISMILLVFFFGLQKFIIEKNQRVKRIDWVDICMLIGHIVNVFSVILAFVNPTNEICKRLDSLLSNRITNNFRVMQAYGISIMGQQVEIMSSAERLANNINGVDAFYLDNAYIALIIRFGIVLYMIGSIAYFKNMYFQKKRGNIELIIVLFIYAIYGVMESGVITLSYNVFLICMASLLYNKKY